MRVDGAMDYKPSAAEVGPVNCPNDVQLIVGLKREREREPQQHRGRGVGERSCLGQHAQQRLTPVDQIRGWVDRPDATERTVQLLGRQLTIAHAESAALADAEG